MTIESQIAELDRNLDALVRSVLALEERLYLQPINDWATRDIVAHLVGWNGYVIEGSRQILRSELPVYDVDPGNNYAKVNAALIREYSSTSRTDLLNELRRSAATLVEFLRSVAPGYWEHDYGVRNLGSVITVRSTVDELIADYEHHTRQIEQFATNQASR